MTFWLGHEFGRAVHYICKTPCSCVLVKVLKHQKNSLCSAACLRIMYPLSHAAKRTDIVQLYQAHLTLDLRGCLHHLKGHLPMKCQKVPKRFDITKHTMQTALICSLVHAANHKAAASQSSTLVYQGQI